MPTLTKQIIEAAIDGFEAQKKHIDVQIAELRGMLNGSTSTEKEQVSTIRRKMSPETLRRMREGQQRRWAKARGESEEVVKTKRKLSAAGRKAIVDALKKRWAAKKAAGTPVVTMAKGRKKAA
jgi:hypothetical protein